MLGCCGKVGYAGLLIATSLTNDTMADVLGDRRWQPLLGRIGGEIMRAAKAEDVTPIGVDGFDAEGFGRGDEKQIASSCDEMADHYRHSAKTRSGIWRDLAVRKRKTRSNRCWAGHRGRRNMGSRRHGRTARRDDREMEDGHRGFGQDNLAELARV